MKGSTVFPRANLCRSDIFFCLKTPVTRRMLSKMICRRTAPVAQRTMATLTASEEFPLTISTSPKAKAAPVIKESTLPNGIKIVSSESGAPVRKISRYCLYNYHFPPTQSTLSHTLLYFSCWCTICFKYDRRSPRLNSQLLVAVATNRHQRKAQHISFLSQHSQVPARDQD